MLGALQPLTYAPELAALLPEVIGRAAAGDFGPLFAGAMLVTGDLDEQSNAALHYSVTCAEDVPRVSPADAAQRRSPACARRRWPSGRSPSARVWPQGASPADATTPVASDVPVLILSGGARSGHAARERRRGREDAADSRHIVARGYGHIVSPHACGPRLIAAFIDDPTLRDAARVLRRALREERAAAAVARPARGAPVIVVDEPGEGVRQARRGARRRRRLVHGAPTARSPDCSAPTAPARRRCCACSRR